MKKLVMILLLTFSMTMPVNAADLTAPTAPDQVQDLIPQETESFSDGLLYVLKSAFQALNPEISAGCGICLSVIAAAVLTSLLSSFQGVSKSMAELVGSVMTACLLLGSANALIGDASSTVVELSEYGKLLLPVMTAALAAEGGVTGSAAIYTGTAVFDAVLCSVIRNVLLPLIYVFLALATAHSALGEQILKKIRDFIKWLSGWVLKTVLYVFTGYITITGVISGATDQAALKAAKLAISGMVPVVGGIMSDASEAVLVSAGMVKNAAGVYGLIVIIAVAMGPFLRIGVQYLLLKMTAAICEMFSSKRISALVSDFSSAMGLLLAMTGAVCLLLMISVVCFMKGVNL